jgi:hypothetical protein
MASRRLRKNLFIMIYVCILPILLIFCLFANAFAPEIYVVYRQRKIFTLMSNKVYTHCLKCVFSSFCFSITSSFRGVGCSIFGTKLWREDNWKRNRFVFGNIKRNWTPFCNGTPRIHSADNNYKKCVLVLKVEWIKTTWNQ